MKVDLVTLKPGESIHLNGQIRTQQERTDGLTTAVWFTDGVATYVVRGQFGAEIRILQPGIQAKAPCANLEECQPDAFTMPALL